MHRYEPSEEYYESFPNGIPDIKDPSLFERLRNISPRTVVGLGFAGITLSVVGSMIATDGVHGTKNWGSVTCSDWITTNVPLKTPLSVVAQNVIDSNPSVSKDNEADLEILIAQQNAFNFTNDNNNTIVVAQPNITIPTACKS